jgi:hypothetical protein
MKQSKACKTNFKQLQYEDRLSSKPTPRSKGDKNRVKHKRGRHVKKQNLA